MDSNNRKSIDKHINNRKKSIGSIEKDTEKLPPTKLEPLNISDELNDSPNILIKIVVCIEVYVINIFLNSIKLFTDLPKLLAYITDYSKYLIAQKVLLLSVIYVILHYLARHFGKGIFRPIFHVYVSYILVAISLVLYLFMLKHRNDDSDSEDSNNYYAVEDSDSAYEEDIEDEDINYEDSFSDTLNIKEKIDIYYDDNDSDDTNWGISDIPQKKSAKNSIVTKVQPKADTKKEMKKERISKATDISEINILTKPNIPVKTPKAIPNIEPTIAVQKTTIDSSTKDSSTKDVDIDIDELDSILDMDSDVDSTPLNPMSIIDLIKGGMIYQEDSTYDGDDDIEIIK